MMLARWLRQCSLLASKNPCRPLVDRAMSGAERQRKYRATLRAPLEPATSCQNDALNSNLRPVQLELAALSVRSDLLGQDATISVDFFMASDGSLSGTSTRAWPGTRR